MHYLLHNLNYENSKERFNCEDINSVFVWDNAKTDKSIEIYQLI